MKKDLCEKIDYIIDDILRYIEDNIYLFVLVSIVLITLIIFAITFYMGGR